MHVGRMLALGVGALSAAMIWGYALYWTLVAGGYLDAPWVL